MKKNERQLSFESDPGKPSEAGAAKLKKTLDIDRRASREPVIAPARVTTPPAENVWSLAEPSPAAPHDFEGLHLADGEGPAKVSERGVTMTLGQGAPTLHIEIEQEKLDDPSSTPPFDPAYAGGPHLGDTAPAHSAPALTEATLAPAALRAYAWLVDGAVLGGLFLLYCLMGLWAFGFAALPASHERGIDYLADTLVIYRGLIFPGLAVVLVVAFVYQAIFVTLGGRTPGQRMAGIRIVRLDGTALSASWAAIRAAAAVFSFSLGLAGLAWVFVDRRRQALHDKITKTVVVLA